jgi:Cupin-like domain
MEEVSIMSQLVRPDDDPGKGMTAVVHAAGVAIAATRRLDDDWRRWIAENLLLEMPPDSILQTLVANGFSSTDGAAEITLAMQSPYLRAADRLRNRLRKRNWLLASYRKLGRLHPGSGEIERRHRLPRGEFLEGYYCPNRPVIITGMMDDWPALGKWSLEFFAERFGDREVEVQVDRKAGGHDAELERSGYARSNRRMRFSELIEKLRTSGVTNDFYMTANNSASNKGALPELWDDIIQIPEYLDGDAPLNGFFWLGPAGTITPFHHDLTNNLMAQVIGRKRVKIVPSWDLPLMRNLYHVYCELDGRDMPPAPRADSREPQVLECILNPGEILFLPVGCLHFVEGLDVSVTVSFTNFVFDNDFSSFYTTYQVV